MNLRKGNMFDHVSGYDVMLVTTNATLRKDGALVMGRGAALEAAKLHPWLPRRLGDAIRNRPEYGILVPDATISEEGCLVGAFQVKRHWRDPADPALIAFSAWKLHTLAHTFIDMRFALNFPGIGNGRLERDLVLPQLQSLPKNVDVWEL